MISAMEELIRLATGTSVRIVFGPYCPFRIWFHFGPLGSMGPEERERLESTEEEETQLDFLLTNFYWREDILGYHKTPWLHAPIQSCVRLITGNLGPSR